MGGLFKPWRIVGVSITESELSDSISNILHHFMVAHSQSQNTIQGCTQLSIYVSNSWTHSWTFVLKTRDFLRSLVFELEERCFCLMMPKPLVVEQG